MLKSNQVNLVELKRVADALPDGICVARASGEIILANQALLDLTGHAHHHLVGSAIGDAFPEIVDLPPVASPGDSAVHVIDDGSVRCADSAVIPASVSASWVDNSGSRVLLVTARDLSRQRKIEYRLRQEIRERVALNHIASAVNSDLELDRILRTVASELKRLIPYDRISVSLVNGPHPGSVTTVFVSGVKIEGWEVGRAGPPAGNVIEHARPRPGVVLMTGDEPEIPVLAPVYEAGLRSWLMVSLGSPADPVGYLSLRSLQKHAYSLREAALLESVAAQLAPAILNAQMHHETRRIAEVRKLLTQIGRVISSTLEISDIFEDFAQLLTSLVPADRVVIAYIDSEKETVRDAFIWGVAVPEWDSGEPRSFSEASTSMVVAMPDGLIESADDFPDTHRNAGLASGMYAPLISDGGLIGSLNVKSTSHNAYSEDDLRILRMVATQISGAVAASRLYERTLELSAQRELAALLDAENKRLQSENEFKARLISTVSHELRTPLTSVMAFADILKRNSQGNLTERQQQHVELIRKGSRSLFIVIDDLLFASRMEAGTLNLDIRPFLLSELVRELSVQLQVITGGKNQSLVLLGPEDDLRVIADRLKLTQAVSNLVTNASKYSPEDTEVRVTFTAAGHRLRVDVADQGIGIRESDLNQLFKTYFRADNDATRSQQGTGLGLYIVKTITELHGGEVTVTSEPGVGSVFTIELPLDCSAASTAVEDESDATAA